MSAVSLQALSPLPNANSSVWKRIYRLQPFGFAFKTGHYIHVFCFFIFSIQHWLLIISMRDRKSVSFLQPDTMQICFYCKKRSGCEQVLVTVLVRKNLFIIKCFW